MPAKLIAFDIDDAAQHLAVVGSGSPSDLGKEGLNAPHLLRTQPEVSCIALVDSRRETVNVLVCKPNLWGLTLSVNHVDSRSAKKLFIYQQRFI